MPQTGNHYVFDAEAAFRAATLAVIGLSSSWKYHLQESDRNEIVVDSRTTKAPDTLMMEGEGVETILRAIESLPESYRQVITFLSEGKGPREIAEILDCSPNAATIRCSRARRALMKKLNGQA